MRDNNRKIQLNNTNAVDDENCLKHKYEFDVALEEFKELRSEILARLSSEKQILNFSVGLIAATIAVVKFQGQLDTLQIPFANSKILTLVLSILFAAIGLMYIEEDIYMSMLGKYINTKLRPQLEKIIVQITGEQTAVLMWEEFKASIAFRSFRVVPFFLLTVARYALTVLPSIFCYFLYFYLQPKTLSIPTYEIILRTISFILIFCVVFMSIYNGLLYVLPENIKAIFKERVRGLLDKPAIFIIPVLTLSFGFIPMVILSYRLNALWLNSPYEFPLLKMPTVLIGDSIFLPLFNYRAYEFIRKNPLKNLKKQWFVINLAISIGLSYLVNYFTHQLWTSDNHFGFMDIVPRELSVAGYYHFWFSLVQISVVVFFIGYAMRLYSENKIVAFKGTLNIWKIIIAFSSLTIFDFMVRQFFIYQNKEIIKALYNEASAFSSLIVSLILYFVGKLFLFYSGKKGLRIKNKYD